MSEEYSYCVYILRCSDNTLYIGSTADVEKRIHAHNHTKSGAKYTRARRPVVLEYAEKGMSYGLARTKEAELKRYTREQKIEYIKKHKK